jgi:hypothetical protein
MSQFNVGDQVNVWPPPPDVWDNGQPHVPGRVTKVSNADFSGNIYYSIRFSDGDSEDNVSSGRLRRRAPPPQAPPPAPRSQFERQSHVINTRVNCADHERGTPGKVTTVSSPDFSGNIYYDIKPDYGGAVMQNVLEGDLIRYVAPRPRESAVSALLKTAPGNLGKNIRALRNERKDLMHRQGVAPIDSDWREAERLKHVDPDEEIQNMRAEIAQLKAELGIGGGDMQGGWGAPTPEPFVGGFGGQ